MIIRFIKWGLLLFLAITLASVAYFQYLIFSFDHDVLPANYGKFDTELYLVDDTNRPLIVGFGGAEGGNAWASDYWSAQRQRFLADGFNFLALGYFGMEGVSEELDRVPLDGVMEAILNEASSPAIDPDCIILIGGSKGAELSLAMAGYYSNIKSVVAIVPGNAIFAGLTTAMVTPSFSMNDEPLPFVPVPWSATPALIRGDLRAAWVEMLKNTEAVEKAAIQVENINGPILFLSATKDELWPSTEMSVAMVDRLQANEFPHYFEHVAIDGYHATPLEHFDIVEKFLEEQVGDSTQGSCSRL